MSGGDGGRIEIHSAGDVILNGSLLSAGARGGNGNGGTVAIEAGVAGPGHVRSLGNVNVVGEGGNGGQISIDFSSPEVLTMASNGKGELFAYSLSGVGGDITINNHAADLRISVNDTISVLSSSGGSGTISLVTSGGDKIDLTGPGTLQGNVVATAKSDVSIALSGKTILDVQEISSQTGNVTLEFTAKGSKITFASALQNLEATKGNVTIKTFEISDFDNGKQIVAASKLDISSVGSLKITSDGGKISLLDSSPTVDRSIQIQATSLTLVGSELQIDSSRVGNPGGNVSITATDGNISNSGLLNIKTDGLGAGTVSISAANGSNSINNVNISAQTFDLAGKRGVVNISAFENLTIYGKVDASSQSVTPGDVEPGGTITLHGLTVITPDGKNLALTATGAELGGGKVEIVSSKSLNLSRTTISVAVIAGNGVGGNIRLNTAGTLSIGGTLDVSGRGTGAGGTIDVDSGTLNLASHLFLNADGGNHGDGGTAMINVSKGALKLGLDTDSSAVSISTLGGTGATSGTQDITAQNGLTLESGGIRFNLTTGVSAESLKLSAPSGTLRLNGSLRAEGSNPTLELKGGDIKLSKGQAFIVAGKTGSNATGTLLIVADNSASPTTTTGNVVLNDSIMQSSNLIEIAGSTDNLNLNVGGTISTGKSGTVVIRNSSNSGSLNISLLTNSELSAGTLTFSTASDVSVTSSSTGQLTGTIIVNPPSVSSPVNSITITDKSSTGLTLGQLHAKADVIVTTKGSLNLTEQISSSEQSVRLGALQSITIGQSVTAAKNIAVGSQTITFSGNGSLVSQAQDGSITLTGTKNPSVSGPFNANSDLTISGPTQSVVSAKSVNIQFAEKLTVSDFTCTSPTLTIGGSQTSRIVSVSGSLENKIGDINITLNNNKGICAVSGNSLSLNGGNILAGGNISIEATSDLNPNPLQIAAVAVLAPNGLVRIHGQRGVNIGGSSIVGGPSLATDILGHSVVILGRNAREDLPQSLGQRPFNLGGGGTVFFNSGIDVNLIQGGNTADAAPGTSIIFNTSDQKGAPIKLNGSAHIQAISSVEITGDSAKSLRQLIRFSSPLGTVWSNSSKNPWIELTPTNCVMRNGNFVLAPKSRISLHTTACKVIVTEGSVVQFSQDFGVVTIRNLFESGKNAVRVVLSNGTTLSIKPGEEFTLAKDNSKNSETVARRNVVRHQNWLLSEFSITSLAESCPVTRALLSQKCGMEKSLTNRITKMFACLGILHSNRGRFSVDGK